LNVRKPRLAVSAGRMNALLVEGLEQSGADRSRQTMASEKRRPQQTTKARDFIADVRREFYVSDG
jgi:hypothetical protein